MANISPTVGPQDCSSFRPLCRVGAQVSALHSSRMSLPSKCDPTLFNISPPLIVMRTYMLLNNTGIVWGNIIHSYGGGGGGVSVRARDVEKS